KLQGVVSYTYTNGAGIVPLNALQRHNMSIRLSGILSKKWRFDTKLEYMRQNIDNNISEGESSYNPFRQIYTTPPNIRLEDLKEYEFINASGLPQQNYWSTVITGANPYWTIYRNLRKNSSNQFVSMGTLSYMITDNLKAMLRGSYIADQSDAEEKSYYGTFRDPFGAYSVSTGKGSTYSGEFLLNYTKQFAANWSFDGNAGSELRHNKTSLFAANTGAALNIPNVFSISNTQLPITSNAFTEYETQSLWYDVKLGWKKALFLEHTGRNDWNSTLPASNRSFFYPSIGISAVLTDLFSLPEAFTYLKLRGSLAQVGNGTSPHQLSRYATSIAGGTSGYILLGSTLPNKTLKPEQTVSRELGLEASMFANRLGLDLTLYKTNTNNQLFSQAIPVGSGSLNYLTNGGDVQNSGIEIILNARPVATRDFKWDVSVNYALNKSLVKRLSDQNSRLVIGTDTYMRDFVLEAGKPFGLMYGKGFQRDSSGRVLVNPSTGLPQVTAGRTVLLGNVNPLWTGGFSSTFSYKKWTAGFVISHKQGGSIASYTDAILYGDGLAQGTVFGREGGLVFGKNIFQDQQVVNSDGSNTTKEVTAQQLWGLLANRNTPVAEVLMKSATNTRLREATIGYVFTAPKLGNWKLASIEVTAVGRNLFFIHRASPTIDPDFMVGTGTVSEGFQSFPPPTTRSYGISAKVNF
ncbi:MAG: TonB-dependent receptor, partial [Niabella sp.]|nr:TonB-dependent receptor [Niabella sp.]